jgi:GDP-L-fucose synthase
LIRRFHEAKVAGVGNVVVWGTARHGANSLCRRYGGRLVHLMKSYSGDELVNIGTGETSPSPNLRWRHGRIYWPDQLRRLNPTARRASCSTSAASPNCWSARTTLEDGIRSPIRRT